MITNIPTHNDFAEQGITFLNLAWDAVLELLLDYAHAEEHEAIADEEQPADYWKAAQKHFSTAIALTQQGVELLLKAKIAQVSPYLLISSRAVEMPSKCDKQDTSFSAFRTPDAQDLVKIHDTVANERLPEDFKILYERLRVARNMIFHTVDKESVFTEKDIIHDILAVSDFLIEPRKWTFYRKSYLEERPSSIAWSTDAVSSLLCREMLMVLSILPPAETQRYLGFNKKQRAYICPECTRQCGWADDEIQPATAQLNPNSPSSVNVHCFVCLNDFDVVRKKCDRPDCKGNVILDGEDCECLTCFASQI